jgi:hypothetical protein
MVGSPKFLLQCRHVKMMSPINNVSPTRLLAPGSGMGNEDKKILLLLQPSHVLFGPFFCVCSIDEPLLTD